MQFPLLAASFGVFRRVFGGAVLLCVAATAVAQIFSFSATATGNFGADTGVRIAGVSATGTAVGTSFAAGGMGLTGLAAHVKPEGNEAAVPEPSAYAAFVGLAAFGLVGLRRRAVGRAS